MAVIWDTTTVLNPGVGGDSMDESAIYDSSGTLLGKRPRVVLGGEQSRNAVVEPVLVDPAQYAIPVVTDPAITREAEKILTKIHKTLKKKRRT